MTACFDWWHLEVQDRRVLVGGVLLIDAVEGSQKNLKGHEDEREGDQTTLFVRF